MNWSRSVTDDDRNRFRRARPTTVGPVRRAYVSPVAASRPAPSLVAGPSPVPTAEPQHVPDVLTAREVRQLRDHLSRMLRTAGNSWALDEHRPFDAVIRRSPPWVQRQVTAYRRGALLQRLVFTGFTGVIILSILIPVLSIYLNDQRYKLDAATSALVGSANTNLVSKISYDSQSSSYYFNKDGISTGDASPAAALKSQVGGSGKDDKSLYSVQLPTDPTKGVTYYDDNLDLSFSLTPDIHLMAPKEVDGHLVYPASDGMQDVFTTKNNGLKDDIVLTKPGADSTSYSYKLKLPSTLEAKMIDNSGEVGIYSANPALFNNISFGDNASRSAVQKARENGTKDNLVFVLPAPVIKEYDAKSGSKVAPAAAHFVLSQDGKTLTVEASNLSHLSYPLTIDPSVVTTSTTDFGASNNEDNIDYSTANQVNRGDVSGGSLNPSTGSWGTVTSLPASRGYATSVAYNGYLYEIGGYNGSVSAVVNFAQINSDGTLGSWGSATSLPTATYQATSVAYNGYLYEIGGNAGGATTVVDYAPINSNGTLGSWTATASLPVATTGASSAVYNGYIYEIGNIGGGSGSTVVDYAAIKADGTLGSWTATTSLTTANYNSSAAAYNGYLYNIGGSGSGQATVVAGAPIKADGTIGAWSTTTALPTGTSQATVQAYEGYMYVMNVGGATTTDYAPINSNGTLGAWTATSALPTANFVPTSAAYNGYIYEIGGGGTGTYTTAVDYAQIAPAGQTTTNTWNSATSSTITNSSGGICSVAYNGYLYYFGGSNGTTYWANFQYATINGDGTIGNWSTNSTFSATPRTKTVCAAYNGYLYVGGGFDNVTYYNDFYQSQITPSTGAAVSWVTDSNLPLGGFGMAMTAYNGYMYLAGGTNGTSSSSVYYASLDPSTGIPGTWNSSTSLNAGTVYGTFLPYNGYLYLVGGANNGTSNGNGNIEYTTINTNGTLGASWTSQSYTSTVTIRIRASAAIWNGYLYMYGGDDNNVTYYTDINYAPLNANGSVGTWTTENSTLSPGRSLMGSAAYNGYIYEVGGKRGSAPAYGNDTQSIALNNGGSGAAGNWTTASNPLPSAAYSGLSGIRDIIVSASNGYLYALGGNPGSTGSAGAGAVNTIYYSPISSGGAPGTWSASSHSMQHQRAAGTAIPYNGYLYVFGGYSGSGQTNNNVEYALICTGSNSGVGGCSSTAGDLGTWTLGTSFTNANMYGGVGGAEWNGYFYVAGGINGGSPVSVVDYAKANADGSIGSWTATTSMTSGRSVNNQVLIYNGYLYVVGGLEASNVYDADVEYAQINSSTHALGSFTDLANDLPWAQWSQGTAVAQNGFIYLYSGLGYQYGSSLGRQTPITPPLVLAAVSAPGSKLPAPTSSTIQPEAQFYNGYLYQIGGFVNTGTTYFADVQYAPVSAIARVGHYSQLIDLKSATNFVDGISYNGFLPDGQVDLTYRTAGSNAIFGSTQGGLVLGSAVCQTGTTSSNYTSSTRYVQVNAAFDDSNNGVFPDSISNTANLTDFTVNYSASIHPAPQVRLRLGQPSRQGLCRLSTPAPRKPYSNLITPINMLKLS